MGTAHALQLLAVPVAAVAVAALARRSGLAVAPVLVLAGLVASAVPGMPRFTLDPKFVLFVFLPPLLFSAAWESSYYDLKANVRAIASLSVGLVLFTTFAVGWVTHLVVPGLPLAAAFVLGALVAPPDAVAAVSVARRLGLPRRLVTILVGESLFNDATALTVFRVAVAAAAGEGVTLLDATGRFVYAAVAGAIVGLLLGPPLHRLSGRLDDPLVETAVPVLAPFAAYLIAETVHASGVIAVVVSGLYLGHKFFESSAMSRLLGISVWRVMVFMLESVVFLLIGLQLTAVLSGLSARSRPGLAWYALAVFLTVVVTRFVWVFAADYLPIWFSRRVREREAGTGWRQRVIISWAGMRGVVSLAAAFAIPMATENGRPFPGRDLLLFLTFSTVLATLVVQGLTFPALIRALGLQNEAERRARLLAAAAAYQAATEAALARLDELAAREDSEIAEEIIERLRMLSEYRRLKAWERLGGGIGPGGREVPSETYRRLRLEMLAAERETFLRLRDERRIDDELLEEALEELDLEEVMVMNTRSADL
ncbi:MAG: monovalent cation/hydrogen antiporter [Streptosporangiaceae bacterium]|jgi:CPA1 family monovalent cation:H+ antiporter|nr:monovalent cation/hydrogen antiporter [Streptosporangiaceae bacterium]